MQPNALVYIIGYLVLPGIAYAAPEATLTLPPLNPPAEAKPAPVQTEGKLPPAKKTSKPVSTVKPDAKRPDSATAGTTTRYINLKD